MFKHTVLMKFGRPLSMIIQCTVQWSVAEVVGTNTILKIIDIIKKRLKSKFNKLNNNIQHTIIMKIGRPLAMIVHYRVQSIWECCESTGLYGP